RAVELRHLASRSRQGDIPNGPGAWRTPRSTLACGALALLRARVDLSENYWRAAWSRWRNPSAGFLKPSENGSELKPNFAVAPSRPRKLGSATKGGPSGVARSM